MTSVFPSHSSTMSHHNTYRTSYNSSYRDVKSSGYGGKSPSPTPKDTLYETNRRNGQPARVHGLNSIKEIPRNHVTAKAHQYESRMRTSSGSSTRPLPNGPGPVDSNNQKITVAEATSKLKHQSKRPSDPRSPLKGNHGLNFTSTQASSSTSYNPPSAYGYNHHSSYYDNSSSSLIRGRKYSSTSSLNSESSNSIKEDYHDLKSNAADPSASTSSRYNHTSNYRNEKELPDIHSISSRVNGTSVDYNHREQRSRRDSLQSNDSDNDRPRRSSSVNRIRDSTNNLLLNTSSSNKYSSQGSGSSSHYSDVANNNRGLLGISNLGNTCYMNSMIQGLANTRPLLEYLCDERWSGQINPSSRMKGSLIKAFGKLVKTMWSSTSSSHVSPTSFRGEINRFARRFSGYGQQDAQEFLTFLVEGLHEDVNKVQNRRPKSMLSDEFDKLQAYEKARETWKWYLSYDNSFMVDLFVGQLKSSLTCLVCGYVSNTFDPFWEIPLPLRKRTLRDQKLSECFDDFTREEILEGDERPTCAHCKKRQRCKKAFSIWKFPRILVLHLKRFDPMASYPTKLTTSVDFQVENLNLSKYAANDTSNSSNCTYDLYAVSNHIGTARGGHYTAYTKHPYSNEWHHFNDTRCSSINKRAIVSAEAYVLFYESRDSTRHNSNNSHL